MHPENSFFQSKKHFFDIRSKKKFLLIEESFVDSKKCSLMNFFFDRISKKLFSQCDFLK